MCFTRLSRFDPGAPLPACRPEIAFCPGYAPSSAGAWLKKTAARGSPPAATGFYDTVFALCLKLVI